ncbi:hypothetical protein BHE74_00048725 [Ensete ventricosum]|uniref:Uncharacterized protein n=1 Tax=Ensete ventricosum TaxID=4639 RepID=A0A444E3A8_ENSVE|nr:hypothetical protein B296_00046503 [Ensete ventricosum]RWW04862.1 hypothetical protein GW17_00031892 [Ensete ventricosum]RWW45438.1 hypothetical protein BHE74_00048725 [Ensete ventricosum]
MPRAPYTRRHRHLSRRPQTGVSFRDACPVMIGCLRSITGRTAPGLMRVGSGNLSVALPIAMLWKLGGNHGLITAVVLHQAVADGLSWLVSEKSDRDLMDAAAACVEMGCVGRSVWRRRGVRRTV